VRWSLEHGMSVRRIGSGPHVVWIHGLGESSTSFDPVVAGMPGFTHVLPDLPGYGRSPWPAEPTGLDALAELLAAWAATEPPAIWIGHSMGGVLATLVAERAPVRGLVNVEGNITRGDCVFSGQAAAFDADAFASHGLAELRARVYADGLAHPPLRGYAAAMYFASPRVFHRHACDLVALSASDVLAPRLARLRACSVRTATLSPAGHWAHLDQPSAFLGTVLSSYSGGWAEGPDGGDAADAGDGGTRERGLKGQKGLTGQTGEIGRKWGKGQAGQTGEIGRKRWKRPTGQRQAGWGTSQRERGEMRAAGRLPTPG
jgi:pimeloyl-ACP methyl ester carboxylesterase